MAFDRNQVGRTEDGRSRRRGRDRSVLRGDVDANVDHCRFPRIDFRTERRGHLQPAAGNKADEPGVPQFDHQQIIQADIRAVGRATPRCLGNDACDHADRGRRRQPVNMYLVGLPAAGQTAEPQPLGIDQQVLDLRFPIALAEHGRQRAKRAARPQQDFLHACDYDVPGKKGRRVRMFQQFGRVSMNDFPRWPARHEPHVASPPQQFLDFGNQEGFAHAIGQCRSDVEDFPGAVFPVLLGLQFGKSGLRCRVNTRLLRRIPRQCRIWHRWDINRGHLIRQCWIGNPIVHS